MEVLLASVRIAGEAPMAERSERVAPRDRRAFLEQLRESGLINTEASVSSVFDMAAEIPAETTQLTIMYDDAKWFAVMP
jgi:hypothetical protein